MELEGVAPASLHLGSLGVRLRKSVALVRNRALDESTTRSKPVLLNWERSDVLSSELSRACTERMPSRNRESADEVNGKLSELFRVVLDEPGMIEDGPQKQGFPQGHAGRFQVSKPAGAKSGAWLRFRLGVVGCRRPPALGGIAAAVPRSGAAAAKALAVATILLEAGLRRLVRRSLRPVTLHRTHTRGRFALHERGRAGLVVMLTVELLERVEFRGRMLARVKGCEMPRRRLIRECGPGCCDGGKRGQVPARRAR